MYLAIESMVHIIIILIIIFKKKNEIPTHNLVLNRGQVTNGH